MIIGVAATIGLVDLIQSIHKLTVTTSPTTGKITVGGTGADSPIQQQLQNAANVQITAHLQEEAKALGISVTQLLGMEQSYTSLNGMVGKTAPQIGAGFIGLEGQLQQMGLSFTQSVSATDGLQAYITKYGPLTSTQMLAFYNDVKNGVSSAFDIALSLKTASENLQSLPENSAQINNALAAFKKSIPTIGGHGSSGQGFVRAGGGPIFEDVVGIGANTGLPWTFHAGEMVVAKNQVAGSDFPHIRRGAAGSGNMVIDLIYTNDGQTLVNQ